MNRALALAAAKAQRATRAAPEAALPALMLDEPLGERVRRMQAEARRLAFEHADVLASGAGGGGTDRGGDCLRR